MYNDELHKGEHTTIISKSLYDKCQRVMERRGHAQPTAAEASCHSFSGLAALFLRHGHYSGNQDEDAKERQSSRVDILPM